MPKTFNWQKSYNCSMHAEMPDNITLVVSPDRTTHFGTRVARGSSWRAQASHWDEATRTMSRFGRDEYSVQHKTAKDAMRAAESLYRDCIALRSLLPAPKAA